MTKRKIQVWPAKKELDPFVAGWNAAMEYTHHEWGPEPPKTPQTAKVKWNYTCDLGHTIRVNKCTACRKFKGSDDNGVKQP